MSSPDVLARFKAIESATSRTPRKFELPRDDLGRAWQFLISSANTLSV